MAFTLPPDPKTERRTRITGWVTFAVALLFLMLLAYLAYVAYEGSRQLTDAPSDSTDCRTPALSGWSYEAINYDVESDAVLQAETDPEDCPAQGETAGDALTGPGDVGLAGWYVPSGSGSGPTGPTVVIVHGWGSNKSAMLDRAAILHDAYNLVLFDLRNHGQSEAAPTTQGVREAGDLRAVIDWLGANKGPERIALLGVSMGGATALNEADDDDRIDAVIVESTHATLANATQARLERSGYPLSLPGSWAILLGTLMRTGEDVSSADPVQAMERLDRRPVLIVSGGRDESIGANDADELLAAAEEAGSPAELHVCAASVHAESNKTCPDDYAAWVLGFLERVLGPAG
jgi:pimeloyl-ACP methyl ester carboxylesterase